MFEELVKLNCFSENDLIRKEAAELLEREYGCEINCIEMSESVRFAHHGRGCTIVAAKLCDDVVIFQNVTIGANQKFNRKTARWENLGNPILGPGVIVADGAKILGPVVIGENTVVGAGAIITKDIPANSVAYGVNQFKAKPEDYDLVFRNEMPTFADILAANQQLIKKYQEN
ncbi:serine acetyltransferase [Enterococcus asini]|uniref:serine acetyltransferase n=1 Tax=Enterococcus asini TaxID=57732 RepID=UPI00288CC73E|nr:serine acetyltransferase [Enterococcus asini]MDT2756405.1 serine acetyltransferase [Enterococcus asini]